MTDLKTDLKHISPGYVGQCERLHKSNSIIPIKGPILAEGCCRVCETCQCF